METMLINYGADFGGGDGSDMIEWEVDLTGEAERDYLHALRYHTSLEDYPTLVAAMESARDEIAEQELQNMLDMGDEYAMECQGLNPVDADELHDLALEHDERVIAFFGLEAFSDEELEEWYPEEDALPAVREWEPDFRPVNPFDAGWSLTMEFADHPEDEEIDEEEARKTIGALLTEEGEAAVLEYVELCGELYEDGEDALMELAKECLGEEADEDGE